MIYDIRFRIITRIIRPGTKSDDQVWSFFLVIKVKIIIRPVREVLNNFGLGFSTCLILCSLQLWLPVFTKPVELNGVFEDMIHLIFDRSLLYCVFLVFQSWLRRGYEDAPELPSAAVFPWTTWHCKSISLPFSNDLQLSPSS